MALPETKGAKACMSQGWTDDGACSRGWGSRLFYPPLSQRAILAVLAVSWAVLLVITCGIAGCGYKTNPRPALAKIPGPVGDLGARVYPGKIILTWQKPISNTDGSSFDDLSGYKLYRYVQKIGEECEQCDERGTLYANIDAGQPVDAVIRENRVTFTDTAVKTGNVYGYTVSAYNLKGREGQASRNVLVTVEEPPPPVRNLQAEMDQKGVILVWEPVQAKDTLNEYRIYRGDTSDPAEMSPIGTVDARNTEFTDPHVEREKTYYYTVRSVKMINHIPSESLPSVVVNVTIPRIRWSAPQGIKVVPARNEIRILWNPVTIPNDETRYHIYRSELGKAFEKLNDRPLKEAWFNDRKVVKGRTYRYAVTACPSKNPEEESARSASEMVMFEP